MPKVEVSANDNGLFLRFGYHPTLFNAIKEIPSRRWDKEDKVHYIGKYDLQNAIIAFLRNDYEVEYTDTALEIIKEFRNRRTKLMAFKTGTAHESKGIDLKLPLRPFQKVGHDFLLNAGRCLLCDEMGLGKTVQVISTFKSLKEAGKVKKLLVLCPSSVKGQWRKDIHKFTDFIPLVVEGTPKARKEQYKQEYDIIIMTYDTYLSDFTPKKATKKNPNPKPALSVPKVDMLACDECQRLVKIKNKTTQALHILKEKIKLEYIYLMTGTPLINKVEDLWSLMYFVDPELVGEFWQFRARYCEIEYEEIKMLDPKKKKEGKFEKVTRKIPHVVGYKNLEELRYKMEPVYIRREKKEVAKDLPEKIPYTLEVDLTKNQRDLYNTLRDDFLNRFMTEDVTMSNALVWFIRAKQICDTAELVEPSMKDSSKMDELKVLLEDLIVKDNHKVVLFSQYKQMTDIFIREFSDYNPLYIHGGVKSEDRELLIDAFQEDPKHKLFVITLRAGGIGITLTASDVCILYDKWFSPAANNQAIDRIHRIGQTKNVSVIDFICKNTLEERIEVILERKRIMDEAMFGDDKAILQKLTPEELRNLL